MSIFDIFRRKNKSTQEKNLKRIEEEKETEEGSEIEEEYLDVEDDIELPSEEFNAIPKDEKEHKNPTTKIDEEEGSEEEEDKDEDEEEEDDEILALGLDKEVGIYEINPRVKLTPAQLKALKQKGKKKFLKHKVTKEDIWGGRTSERNLHREVGGTEIDYEALRLAMERGFGGTKTINELIEKSERDFERNKGIREGLHNDLNYKRYIRRKVIKKLVKSAMSDGVITKQEYKQIKIAKKGSVLDLTVPG